MSMGRLQSMADEAFAMGAGDPGQRGATGRCDPRSKAHAALDGAGHARRIHCRGLHRRAHRWLFLDIGVRRSPMHQSEQTRRDVTLADGSVVHLDVDSEINVSFSSGHRDITLVNGRALFEVAHDASRPFVVSAGQSHTTALGTHFQVQREASMCASR